MLEQHCQPLRDLPLESSKRCSKCGEVKPATSEHFITENRNGGTLTAHCRTCNAAACRARYAANREKRLAARRTDLEGKARANAQRRERRATDPETRERNRLRCLEYARKNRETARERARTWARNNPDKVAARNAKRQALLAAAGPGYTDADVLNQLCTQGYRCTYCGVPLKVTVRGRFHVDHFIPISKGGRNEPGNICCACPSCNRSKHDRMPFDFLNDLKAARA